jgi:hypothetical protein
MKEEEIYEDELDFIIEPVSVKFTPIKVEELSKSELDEYYEQRYYLENYET